MNIEAIMRPVARRLTPANEISEARKILEEEGLDALPVCHEDGTLAGMAVADEAFWAKSGSPKYATTPLGSVMAPGAVSCMPGDDVMAIAPRAAGSGVAHVAVVDHAGQVVGVADLAPFQQQDFAENDPREGTEEALDEALKETFPASDPISVTPKKTP
jgi:CBS domain-containing protein